MMEGVEEAVTAMVKSGGSNINIFLRFTRQWPIRSRCSMYTKQNVFFTSGNPWEDYYKCIGKGWSKDNTMCQEKLSQVCQGSNVRLTKVERLSVSLLEQFLKEDPAVSVGVVVLLLKSGFFSHWIMIWGTKDS